MDITEKERLLLLKKKEQICELTKQNLDFAHDPQKEIDIKKNFTEILSPLSQIASYSKSKNYNLEGYTDSMNILFLKMTQEKLYKTWVTPPVFIQVLCNYSNSVRFDFTKQGLKIHFPKNLNLGNITNK
jgi:hypothetical protein